MFLVPERQRRVLHRRRSGEAGIGNENIEAAEGEERVAEARSTAASLVTFMLTERRSLAVAGESSAEPLRAPSRRYRASNHAGALLHQPVGRRLAMPPAPP